MRKKALFEGILLLLISLLGIVEGIRLNANIDSETVVDVLGPGLYVLFLSIVLGITGIIHLAANYKKSGALKRPAASKEMRTRMIATILVLATYIFLISITGYLAATLVFFVLEFKVTGIRSWSLNIILSTILTALYYLIFIRYCNLIFPRGIFFN